MLLVKKRQTNLPVYKSEEGLVGWLSGDASELADLSLNPGTNMVEGDD